MVYFEVIKDFLDSIDIEEQDIYSRIEILIHEGFNKNLKVIEDKTYSQNNLDKTLIAGVIEVNNEDYNLDSFENLIETLAMNVKNVVNAVKDHEEIGIN